MKNKAITVSILLMLSCFMVFGFISLNKPESNALIETASIDPLTFKDQFENQLDDKIVPDFFYNIGTRFNSIKKSQLIQSKSFSDFIAEDHAQSIVSYKSLDVIILEDSEKTDVKLTSNSGDFTEEQIKFLNSLSYSTNILIWADYTMKDKTSGDLIDDVWTPYLTIVPEKQAAYIDGKEALLKYLTDNSKDYTTLVQKDILQSAKLYFTVTKQGIIINSNIVTSSGYPFIDEMMLSLIRNMPGTWQPAENANGENVNQELVFSFGKEGC